MDRYPTADELPSTASTLKGCVCPSSSTGPRAQTVMLRKPKAKSERMTDSMAICKLVRKLDASPQEQMLVLHLNNKNEVVSQTMAALGTSDEVTVDPKTVFQAALLANANQVVLVHNHPSGDPSPSPQDVAFTRRMVEAGETLGIRVLDHVVVGEESEGRSACVSFRDRGLIK